MEKQRREFKCNYCGEAKSDDIFQVAPGIWICQGCLVRRHHRLTHIEMGISMLTKALNEE
jgi:ribosomal protein L37AE/L43A